MSVEKKCTAAQLAEINKAYAAKKERAGAVRARLKISERQFIRALRSLGIERWCYVADPDISKRQNQNLRTAEREAILRREEAQRHARFDAIHAVFYGRSPRIPAL